jgi:hypothetical protein
MTYQVWYHSHGAYGPRVIVEASCIEQAYDLYVLEVAPAVWQDQWSLRREQGMDSVEYMTWVEGCNHVQLTDAAGNPTGLQALADSFPGGKARKAEAAGGRVLPFVKKDLDTPADLGDDSAQLGKHLPSVGQLGANSGKEGEEEPAAVEVAPTTEVDLLLPFDPPLLSRLPSPPFRG